MTPSPEALAALQSACRAGVSVRATCGGPGIYIGNNWCVEGVFVHGVPKDVPRDIAARLAGHIDELEGFLRRCGWQSQGARACECGRPPFTN
jgi:hypothetical protein